MLEHLPGRVVINKGEKYIIQGVYAAFPPDIEEPSTDFPRHRFSTADSCCCEVEGEDKTRWLADVRKNKEALLIRRLD
ncbi:MAG: hypothetical protein P8J45_06210 [Phycisphaerales bacterium]|nr:hypothetical protein [Phycisphaerales bacterium]